MATRTWEKALNVLISAKPADTETVLRRHYYAPIPLPLVELFWGLPVDLSCFVSLPVKKRLWNWHQPLKRVEMQENRLRVTVDPAAPGYQKPKRVLAKRNGRIVWPDDLELQVAIWDRPKQCIAKELGCRATSVSARVIARGLISAPPGYWEKVKHGTPVTIPEAVLKAREELAARKKGASGSEGTVSAPKATPAPEQNDQKLPATPEKPDGSANPS